MPSDRASTEQHPLASPIQHPISMGAKLPTLHGACEGGIAPRTTWEMVQKKRSKLPYMGDGWWGGCVMPDSESGNTPGGRGGRSGAGG